MACGTVPLSLFPFHRGSFFAWRPPSCILPLSVGVRVSSVMAVRGHQIRVTANTNNFSCSCSLSWLNTNVNLWASRKMTVAIVSSGIRPGDITLTLTRQTVLENGGDTLPRKFCYHTV